MVLLKSIWGFSGGAVIAFLASTALVGLALLQVEHWVALLLVGLVVLLLVVLLLDQYK